MINTKRTEAVPASLQTPEIQQYLSELLHYKSLSDNERKNLPRLECTASYRNADIFEAFDHDFYSKCYLTEKRYENSYAMDIEHFKTKAFDQYPELKYEWANLYPADHDANMVKPRKDPEGGYLDPCNDDVENEILYFLEFGNVRFGASDANNVKAANTAELLDKIHNGKDSESVKKTETLRALIMTKKEKVLNAIIKWQDVRESTNRQDKFEAETRLRLLLSRKSSFTMLMRCMPAVRRYVPVEFLD